ncbi:unnamed protein product [Lampetra fluviatilis]
MVLEEYPLPSMALHQQPSRPYLTPIESLDFWDSAEFRRLSGLDSSGSPSPLQAGKTRLTAQLGRDSPTSAELKVALQLKVAVWRRGTSQGEPGTHSRHHHGMQERAEAGIMEEEERVTGHTYPAEADAH